MHRSAFVATLIGALTYPRTALRASSPNTAVTAEIEHIERWSTGNIAVVAQRSQERAPFFTYREHAVAPSASTIKLLILLTLFAQADADPRLLTRKIVVPGKDIVGGSEIFGGASAGAAYQVEKLAHAMIAQSDNTASNALADMLGFERINQTAGKLGLTGTRLGRYFNSTPQPRLIGLNHTCAMDLARMMLVIARGAAGRDATFVSQAGGKHMLAFLADQEDRTKIGAGLQARETLANKTGEVSHVRSDVGIVNRGKPGEYVLAIMAYDLDADGRGDETIAHVTRVLDPLIR